MPVTEAPRELSPEATFSLAALLASLLFLFYFLTFLILSWGILQILNYLLHSAFGGETLIKTLMVKWKKM